MADIERLEGLFFPEQLEVFRQVQEKVRKQPELLEKEAGE